MTPSVTVVTLTRHRPTQLARAIASVLSQTYPNTWHLVVIDDCRDAQKVTENLAHARLRTLYASRQPVEFDGLSRVARLRNLAVTNVESPFVAFLDDDNEWYPHHLAELVHCATRTGSRAVHSYRELYRADGSPFTDEATPWAPSEDGARSGWRTLVDEGIRAPYSHVMRDSAYAGSASSVDTSEWLLSTTLAQDIGFVDDLQVGAEDYVAVGEDDRFLQDLRARNVAVATTGLPTLRYYLGGFSNAIGSAP